MLLFLRILFSGITIAFAGYGLITENYDFSKYMILFLGLALLVMGIEEIRKNKKLTGWFLVAVCAFSLFVSIQSFLLG